MSSISLQNVSRRFGSVRAINDISLAVRSREVVTVVGPSGCGKSTLLRIIAGLDFPSSGEIFIDGKPVRDVPARSRNVAMVFQSYALYPHMTTYENLSLNLRLKKVPAAEIERRVRETAELLDIRDLLHKKPHQMSGGQRQRVAVGRALIRKPAIFLFDEPLSNLDALLRERVRHDLKQLFKQIEATVVYVTHDQMEAMTLADRVVVLDRGTVQQIGTPEEIYRQPVNRFVASFIGSPSMNLLETAMDKGSLRIGSAVVQTPVSRSGPVVAGIRPEAFLNPGEESFSESVTGDVLWTENLGSQFLIGVRIDDQSLTVLRRERPSGDRIVLKFCVADLHVFDKDSGRNLIFDRTDSGPCQ